MLMNFTMSVLATLVSCQYFNVVMLNQERYPHLLPSVRYIMWELITFKVFVPDTSARLGVMYFISTCAKEKNNRLST